MNTAICIRCRKEEPMSQFSKDKSRPSGFSVWCRACKRDHARLQYLKHGEKMRAQKVIYRKAVKDKVFTAYGRQCKCCGETEPLFLDIDHMDNDGAEHRKKHRLGTGKQFYVWLITNNFPSNFQTLCCNCNRGKFRNNGICPHKDN